jgi:hypothetical protein
MKSILRKVLNSYKGSPCCKTNWLLKLIADKLFKSFLSFSLRLNKYLQKKQQQNFLCKIVKFIFFFIFHFTPLLVDENSSLPCSCLFIPIFYYLTIRFTSPCGWKTSKRGFKSVAEKKMFMESHINRERMERNVWSFESKQANEHTKLPKYIIGHIKYSNKIPPFYTFTGSFIVRGCEESWSRKK